MKISTSSWFAVLTLVTGNSFAQAPAAPTNGAPRIQFQATTYDFGKLSSGQVARHDFIFTNVGTTILEITAVQPGCGCTSAGNWTKRVEPGKTGIIPLQFNSAGFSGMVIKPTTVTCNDPASSRLTLKLSGNVWKEIDFWPQFAVLNASSESVADAKATVKIVNMGDSPIGMMGLEVSNPMFVVNLKTNQPGKEFELLVKVVPPLNRNSNQGIITLKTTSTNMPSVPVNAILMLQPVVSVAPVQVTLPPPPLNKSHIHTVNVRNCGTNVIKLTDPTVNDSRIGVAVKETETGKDFSVDITIPQGFETKQGQNTEVVVKSSHPLYPELKIPVVQLPAPIRAPAVAVRTAPAPH
jgi:hypothetical protein